MSLVLGAAQARQNLKTATIDLADVVSLQDLGPLHKFLKQIVQQGCKALVVNFKRVVDVDRSCWDCLVSAARRLRKQGGSVILWHCPARLRDELQLRGWDRCFLLPDHRPEDMAALTADVQSCLAAEEDLS